MALRLKLFLRATQNWFSNLNQTDGPTGDGLLLSGTNNMYLKTTDDCFLLLSGT